MPQKFRKRWDAHVIHNGVKHRLDVIAVTKEGAEMMVQEWAMRHGYESSNCVVKESPVATHSVRYLGSEQVIGGTS